MIAGAVVLFLDASGATVLSSEVAAEGERVVEIGRKCPDRTSSGPPPRVILCVEARPSTGSRAE
jgi:hypothetical protein